MSTKTVLRNGQQRFWDAQDFSAFITDFIEDGIADKNGDGSDLAVHPKSPIALAVQVSGGRAYMGVTVSGQDYVERLDLLATEEKSIAANSTGDDRVDAVIARIDVDVAPDSSASNLGTIEVVSGTGTSPLSDSYIQTQIGSDSFVRLADITVPDSAVSIDVGDISDTRVKSIIRTTVNDELDQTIDGIKTFLDFLVLPSTDPTADYEAAHRKFVIDRIAAADTNILQVTAGETVVAGDNVFIKGMTLVELDADEDARVEESNPNTNYNDQFLDVSVNIAAGTLKRGLINFDISGQPASVEKAFVKFVLRNASSINGGADRTLRVANLSGAFDESAVTWNTQPGVDGATADGHYNVRDSYPAGAKIAIDITTIYNTKWSVNNYGLRMQLSNETEGALKNIPLGSSEHATTGYRPKLILLKKESDWDKAFKTDASTNVPALKGIVISGGNAGETISILVTGVYKDASGLTPFALYKANTSGSFGLATNELDAQFQAYSATDLKILDKRREYVDIFGTAQSIYDLDRAITELPAAMLLDNIVETAATDSSIRDRDGYYIAKPDDNGVTARSVGMSTVDVL